MKFTVPFLSLALIASAAPAENAEGIVARGGGGHGDKNWGSGHGGKNWGGNKGQEDKCYDCPEKTVYKTEYQTKTEYKTATDTQYKTSTEYKTSTDYSTTTDYKTVTDTTTIKYPVTTTATVTDTKTYPTTVTVTMTETSKGWGAQPTCDCEKDCKSYGGKDHGKNWGKGHGGHGKENKGWGDN